VTVYVAPKADFPDQREVATLEEAKAQFEAAWRRRGGRGQEVNADQVEGAFILFATANSTSIP
jgi:hypothetical protein